MTEEEHIRLNEIIFCNLFQKLLKQHVNPIKVYDLITAVADVTGANTLILNSVMTIILNNDRQYMPTKREYVHLLKKSDIPVRKICNDLAHISMSTYYSKDINNMHTQPKFSPIQYAEMLKLLQFFSTIYDDMEGVTL